MSPLSSEVCDSKASVILFVVFKLVVVESVLLHMRRFGTRLLGHDSSYWFASVGSYKQHENSSRHCRMFHAMCSSFVRFF